MIDVEQRLTSLTPANVAGLRRLSARATAPFTPSIRNTFLSFSPYAKKLITHLRTSGIKFQPGLSEAEFANTETEFGFKFPPDLRVILSAGLPVGAGFPDWRSPGSRLHLRSMIDFPFTAVSYQIARNCLWCKSWGSKPSKSEKALQIARFALSKAPLMIPIFENCYIPCNPCLSGNPVFFIDGTRIFCCGSDLYDFFEREFLFRSSDLLPEIHTNRRSVSEKSVGSSSNFSRRSLDSGRGNGSGTSRWVEFWSDVAVERCRRNSTAFSSSPGCSSLRPGTPKWVNGYVNRIGSVLRKGGWSETDINEIVHVSAAGFLEGEMVILDTQTVMDLLVLKTGRFSESLQKAGWSSEEVSEAFGFDFQPEKEKKPVKNLSPTIIKRIRKLTGWISRS